MWNWAVNDWALSLESSRYYGRIQSKESASINLHKYYKGEEHVKEVA